MSSLTLASFSDNFFAAANSAVPKASCRFNKTIISTTLTYETFDDCDDINDYDDIADCHDIND